MTGRRDLDARQMPKHARRALLRAAGWTRVGPARGAETWTHDRYPRTFFTLYTATRRQLEDAAP